MRLCFHLRRGPFALAFLFLFAFAWAAPTRAQSGDANYPTPIYSNVVTGRIAPRDVGDARRTRHFYVFRGTEGDLAVRLVSANLIGDVDVFTARTLRPLLKLTLISGTATDATKTVYLREEETLILRVEARAIGDAEGSYRVTLGGAFAPAPAGLAEAPAPELPEAATTERRPSGVRRVTSTGARIAEPTPEPSTEEARTEPSQPAAEPRDEEEAASAPARAPAPANRTANTRRNARTGRSTGTTRRGSARTATPRDDTAAETNADGATRSDDESRAATDAARTGETKTTGTTEADAEPPRPAARPRGRNTRAPNRTGTGTRATADGATSPAESAAPVAPQRLIIMTRSGDSIEHDMSAVRRVTVENNQLVITMRNGNITRRPMSDVLRMSIEPTPQQ